MTDCITAKARVLAAPTDERVAVELTGRQACPGCSCGRLALVPERRLAEVTLDVPAQLREGEEILVTLPESAVLRGALWLHGLPLVGLLLGAAVAAAAGSGDLGCFAGAAGGFFGALALLRRRQGRHYSDAAGGLRVVPTA